MGKTHVRRDRRRVASSSRGRRYLAMGGDVPFGNLVHGTLDGEAPAPAGAPPHPPPPRPPPSRRRRRRRPRRRRPCPRPRRRRPTRRLPRRRRRRRRHRGRRRRRRRRHSSPAPASLYLGPRHRPRRALRLGEGHPLRPPRQVGRRAPPLRRGVRRVRGGVRCVPYQTRPPPPRPRSVAPRRRPAEPPGMAPRGAGCPPTAPSAAQDRRAVVHRRLPPPLAPPPPPAARLRAWLLPRGRGGAPRSCRTPLRPVARARRRPRQRRPRGPPRRAPKPPRGRAGAGRARPGAGRRRRWAAAACVPSALSEAEATRTFASRWNNSGERGDGAKAAQRGTSSGRSTWRGKRRRRRRRRAAARRRLPGAPGRRGSRRVRSRRARPARRRRRDCQSPGRPGRSGGATAATPTTTPNARGRTRRAGSTGWGWRTPSAKRRAEPGHAQRVRLAGRGAGGGGAAAERGAARQLLPASSSSVPRAGPRHDPHLRLPYGWHLPSRTVIYGSRRCRPPPAGGARGIGGVPPSTEYVVATAGSPRPVDLAAADGGQR